MPPFEDEEYGRNQDAVLWDFAGAFDEDGFPRCYAPVAIEVQWKTSRRLANTTNRGVVSLNSEAVVSQKISLHSIMWLGTYATFLGEGSGSGMDDPELYEVVTYQEQKDLRGRETRRVVGLIKWRQDPPTVV